MWKFSGMCCLRCPSDSGIGGSCDLGFLGGVQRTSSFTSPRCEQYANDANSGDGQSLADCSAGSVGAHEIYNPVMLILELGYRAYNDSGKSP